MASRSIARRKANVRAHDVRSSTAKRPCNVKNLASYVRAALNVRQGFQGEVWFRGQPEFDLPLRPLLYRHLTPVADARGNPVDKNFVGYSSAIQFAYPEFRTILARFKRESLPFLHHVPADDFEWMFLMQHYGVPTRLLDWSLDPLAALYFAISDFNDNASTSVVDDGVEVFAIDPIAINGETVGVDAVISLESENWARYIDPTEHTGSFFPICVRPPHIDTRIAAQSSVFTLHGFFLASLESFEPLRPHIRSIRVPKASVAVVRGELAAIGYTRARLFPDLTNVARLIKEDALAEYRRWRENRPSKS